MDSTERLRAVAEAADLDVGDGAIPLPGDSNEAWRIGELVLRICWRGDRERLAREALVLEHLPDDVPHVRVADTGVTDDLSWMVTHWVPGTMLSALWDQCDPAQRGRAAEHVGAALGALHAWDPPAVVRAALASRSSQPDTSDVIGADLNPLPVDRALRLVEPALHLDGVDPRLVVRLGERIDELRHLDPLTVPTEGVVVHGDAHFNTVIWDGDRVVALLDLEWARLGPADLELQPMVSAYGDVIPSLVRGDPAMVAHEHVVERLWLYDLAATLRDLHIKPVPADGVVAPWHPLARLPAMLDGPAYLEPLLVTTPPSR